MGGSDSGRTGSPLRVSLSRATFGMSYEQIVAMAEQGLDEWLDEQLDMECTSFVDIEERDQRYWKRRANTMKFESALTSMKKLYLVRGSILISPGPTLCSTAKISFVKGSHGH